MSAIASSAPCAFNWALRLSARFQQLANDNAACLPGCASHDDSGLDHDRLLLNVVPSCSGVPRGVTAVLLGSMPSAASRVRRECTGDRSSVLSRAAVFP